MEDRYPERPADAEPRPRGTVQRPRNPRPRIGESARSMLRWLGSFAFWVWMWLTVATIAGTTIGLFSVSAFHDLVAELADSGAGGGSAAGIARQREIVLAIRGAVPLASSPRHGANAEPQALYGRIAARLDPLRTATGTLEEIAGEADIVQRGDDGDRRAQEVLFRDTAKRIGVAAADFQAQLRDLCAKCGQRETAGQAPKGACAACGPAGLGEPSIEIKSELERLRSLLSSLRARGGQAQPAVAEQTAQAAQGPRTDGATDPANRQPPINAGPQVAEQIERMDDAFDRLEEQVGAGDPALRKLSTIAVWLARIEVASLALADLDVKARTAAPIEPEALRAKYARAIRELKDAVEGIRKDLSDETAIVAVADAIGDADPQAYRKAATLVREYRALNESRYGPFDFLGDPSESCTGDRPVLCTLHRLVAPVWNAINGVVPKPDYLAGAPKNALNVWIVLLMGALGGLIALIRSELDRQLLGPGQVGAARRHHFVYFAFRPIFSAIVALAVYLLFQTGQITLGGGSASASQVNLPILSIIALIAGLLANPALAMIEQKGLDWFAAQRREALWASGLAQALRAAGKSAAECAAQVGVTPIQVDRWIGGQDKVTPEMQDRILAWLDRKRGEVFGETNPRDIDDGALAWATGLKAALATHPAGIDVAQLALLIGSDAATVQAWADLKRQIDRPNQLLVAQKLGKKVDELFAAERPDADAERWAIGLRNALSGASARYADSESLARAIGSTPQEVRRYMELQAPVPRPVQEAIADALGIGREALFSPDPPPASQFGWAYGLRDRLHRSPLKDAAGLARKLDTDLFRVRAWMEQEVSKDARPPYPGQVAPATQAALAKALDCTVNDLFRTERSASEFWWARMPRFGDLVEQRGGKDALAARLDLDASRIDTWMAGAEPVAPQTRLALLADLGVPPDQQADVFAPKPPFGPQGSQETWWAAPGLRQAVRQHPRLHSLADLAAELGRPPQVLFDIAERIAPLPVELRDGIVRLLGPCAPGGGPLFAAQPPDWSQFEWAPGLRTALAKAETSAGELAELLDVDVERVHDWLELDRRDASTAWARAKVKRGQICPASREAIVAALGERFAADDLFAAARPESGARYCGGTFRAVVGTFEGGAAGFAAQVDTEPERVERWADGADPVESGTQARILKVVGLPEDHADQLFSDQPPTDRTVG